MHLTDKIFEIKSPSEMTQKIEYEKSQMTVKKVSVPDIEIN